MKNFINLALILLCSLSLSINAQSNDNALKTSSVHKIDDSLQNLSEEAVKQIAIIDGHIRAIDAKVEKTRNNQEYHKIAIEQDYYAEMEKIRKSLLDKRLAIISESNPVSK